jgi:hypothetical protein
LAERVVSLFVVRAEAAEGLVALGDDPVLDEPCVAEPEPPESEVSAHAAPAPARIATPTPRPTARPPRRPTYAEALFVELITAPLGIEQTVPHLANPMGNSGHESRKQIPRSSGCEMPARRYDHGFRAQASANRDATVMPPRGNSVNCHFCQFLAVSSS